MNTWFVTRHQGAIDWAQEEGLLPDNVRRVRDFDVEATAAGDLVIGTLPAQLAARICERGGRYLHLTLDLTEELRGKELSAADMRACKARLEEFFIQRASVTTPSISRKRIHLCVVSDQSLQNLLPVRVDALKPDHCVLLLSAGMKRAAADQRLRHALREAGCNSIEVVEGLPDHDLDSIIAWGNALIDRLRKQHPGQHFIFNLTGGNKLMSLGLLQALRPWCTAVYCDTSNDQVEVVHPAAQPSIALAPDLLNLKLSLAAQGFTVRESGVDPLQRDRRADATRWLAENAAKLKDFFKSLNYAAAHYERTNPTPSPAFAPKASPLATKGTEVLVAAGLLERHKGKTVVPQAHAAYLGGGWLEEYCWVIGRELEREGLLKRARFGVGIELDALDQRPQKYPLNELDAAFVHRNRMLIVECKTGDQLGERGQHILNRLEALGENAAGRFASKLLLTTEAQLDPTTRTRAEKYRVQVLEAAALPTLKQILLNWMNGH